MGARYDDVCSTGVLSSTECALVKGHWSLYNSHNIGLASAALITPIVFNGRETKSEISKSGIEYDLEDR